MFYPLPRTSFLFNYWSSINFVPTVHIFYWSTTSKNVVSNFQFLLNDTKSSSSTYDLPLYDLQLYEYIRILKKITSNISYKNNDIKNYRVLNKISLELVLDLAWSGIKSGLLLTRDVYLSVANLLHNNDRSRSTWIHPSCRITRFWKKSCRAYNRPGVVLGEKTWKPTPKTGRGARNWRQRTQIIPPKQRYPFRGRP